MTELLERLCFKDRRILLFEYVQLLFGSPCLYVVLRLSSSHLLLLVELWLQSRDLINDADSAWAIDASRNALLPYVLIIFFEFV